jgi:predicted RNA-binding protein associated with RNAse of E/G family
MGVKNTTGTDMPDSSVFPFRERKGKFDGTVHEYDTPLVHRDGRVAIVKFVMTRAGGPPRLPVTVPAGSLSYGYFWPRRPYNVYRMLTPDQVLLGHRFDAVADVRFSADGVDYLDLILDWWAHPDGTLIEEDRDEFDEAVSAGKLSPAQVARAEEAARQIFSRYRHIIDEVESLERRWVELPQPPFTSPRSA